MRAIRTRRFKLIHNLNWKMPFPIDQDFYLSPTFMDLLNRTIHKLPTSWYKNLTTYYYRPQWELFKVDEDRREVKNLAQNCKFERILKNMKFKLKIWMNKTHDPWYCSPDGVLETVPYLALYGKCMPLYNMLHD